MQSIAAAAHLVALVLFLATALPAFIALDQSYLPDPNQQLARVTSTWYFKALLALSMFAATGLSYGAIPELDRMYSSLGEHYGRFVSALFLSTWLVSYILALFGTCTAIAAGAWHSAETAVSLCRQMHSAYWPYKG